MNFLNYFGLHNLDIIIIGTAVAATVILGFIVFFDNPRSATNKSFLFLALMTSIWSALNYFTYQSLSPKIFILILRLAIFFAVLNSLAVFQLFHVFPNETHKFSKKYTMLLLPFVVIVALMTLTPFVFSGVGEISPDGRVTKVINGPAIPLFGMTVIGLVFGGFFLGVRKMRASIGPKRTQFRFITTGAVISFSLIIIFNLVFPAFFNNPRFVALGAIFLFPFILFTFYAVAKHGLLNVRIISTEILTFVIAIITLIEFLLATKPIELIFRSLVFILVLSFGILLIRSVRREVEQREKSELLTKELQSANTKLKELDDLKTDFISIASHQLRTPLTAIKGYSSMILEGTYGEASLKVRGVMDKIFQSAQRLIYIVNDLLDVSRIEQGRFNITPEEVKVANVLRDVVEELKPNAVKKGVTLDFSISVDDAEVKIKADFNKIRQVFMNLVDNAIKYTLEGFVHVAFERQGSNVLVSMKDSGIGISPASMQNLFQKFSRAKGVSKLHTDGSGLGLYVAREIVAAHGGKVWAESEGEGKGSQFYILLPIEGKQNSNNSNGHELEKFVEGM